MSIQLKSISKSSFIHLIWFFLIYVIATSDERQAILSQNSSIVEPQPPSNDVARRYITSGELTADVEATIVNLDPQLPSNEIKETYIPRDERAANVETAITNLKEVKAAPVHLSFTDINVEQSDTNLKQIENNKFHQLVANTALYYIGVHESSAREYSTKEQRQRYDECHQTRQKDCWDYAYRAEKDVENTVTIEVNSTRDISLILTSFDSVKWVIKGNTQKVKFVYLSGHHDSDIVIPAASDRNIYARFYEPSNCRVCQLSNFEVFHAYEFNSSIKTTVETYFGKPIDLFQGQHKAKQFVIN